MKIKEQQAPKEIYSQLNAKYDKRLLPSRFIAQVNARRAYSHKKEEHAPNYWEYDARRSKRRLCQSIVGFHAVVCKYSCKGAYRFSK